MTARCTGGVPTILNATPRQGFTAELDDSHAEVKFTSAERRSEVTVGCVSGVPRFTVDEDDRGGGSNSGPGGGGSNSGPGGGGSKSGPGG